MFVIYNQVTIFFLTGYTKSDFRLGSVFNWYNAKQTPNAKNTTTNTYIGR